MNAMTKSAPQTTLWMGWEYVEPMCNLRTGDVMRDGFWKCTKSTTASRESVAKWVEMPLTQGGYTRKSAVVGVEFDRAIMLRDETFCDETFKMSVLRHDIQAGQVAA